jgi:hypothetical protein
MMFSRRPTYSERASSSTSDLLGEGIAANSKLSRLLTAGNLASLIRRSRSGVPVRSSPTRPGAAGSEDSRPPHPPGEAQPGGAVYAALDPKPLFAVSINKKELRGTVPILRIEVFDPEIGRFQDVAV